MVASQDGCGQIAVSYLAGAGTSPMCKLAHGLGIRGVNAGCGGTDSNMDDPNENLWVGEDFSPWMNNMEALINRFVQPRA